MTNLNARESLAAFVVVSKQFTGFSTKGILGRKIKKVLGVQKPGPEWIAAEREALAVEDELRARLVRFVEGSPRFFGGEIGEMSTAVDNDLVVACGRMLAMYRNGIVGLAAESSLETFGLVAKKYAVMVITIAAAPLEHRARRERARQVATANAARVAAAIKEIRSWNFAPAPEPAITPAPKPAKSVAPTAFGKRLSAAVAL